MGMEAFNKFYYWIFNKSYYEGIIRENGIKIGSIIQCEPNNIKGGDNFLISRSLKKVWVKPIPNKRESGEILYNDGKKFVCILDVEKSIPCAEEKTIIVNAEKIIIENKEQIKFTEVIQPIVKDKEKITTIKNYKTGKSVLLSQDMPVTPSLLFELLESHFVIQTASVPKTKWEELKWVFIALIIVSGIVLWSFINSGVMTHI